MTQFRKKPVVVEAYQVTRSLLESVLFDGAEYPRGLFLANARYHAKDRTISHWQGTVVTIHGQKTAVIEGDWIIAEPDGEHFYPCKPDVFEATYDLAAAASPQAPAPQLDANEVREDIGDAIQALRSGWPVPEVIAILQECSDSIGVQPQAAPGASPGLERIAREMIAKFNLEDEEEPAIVEFLSRSLEGRGGELDARKEEK